MHVTVRTARSAAHRTLIAIGAMVALVSASDAPLSAVERARLAGANACETDPSATTTDYLLGIACPPEGFETALGYEPLLRRTEVGWRYLKPASAGGGCSGPVRDTGPFWDFADACRTHDYGYDLVRLGAGSRPDADRLLYLDMVESCAGRSLASALGCRAIARWARVTLDIGESLRMDPAPVAAVGARKGYSAHHTRQPFGSGYERVLMLGLVSSVLALQVVQIRPKASERRRNMRRIVGTMAFVTLGVGIGAFIVWFFAQTVVVSLASCTACVGATWAPGVLLFMAVVLGLPFGGWVGYRAARALFSRVGPRPRPFPPARPERIASYAER